jgi:hypothetical protein
VRQEGDERQHVSKVIEDEDLMLRLVCCTDARGQARMRLYGYRIRATHQACPQARMRGYAQTNSAGHGEAQCTGWPKQRQAQSVRAFSGLA